MVVVHEGNSLRVWVNDNLIIENNDFLGSSSSAPLLRAGARANPSPLFLEYNGIIDDIAVYSRGLTMEEIDTYYDRLPNNVSIEPAPTPSCFSNYLPLSGLVGYWPLCEGVSDLSGNNNDGELVGDVIAVTDQQGRNDGAYYFAGSQDWINLPDVLPGDDFSIVIKFRPSSFLCCYNGQVGMTLFSNFTNAVSSFNDPNGLEIGFDTQNNLYLYNGLSFATSNYTFSLNQWHDMIITHENETLQIFVNDSLIVEQSNFLNTDWSSSFIRLGARANVDPLFLEYNGLIDDVAIYNRGLSAQEINNYYNQIPVNSSPCVSLPSNLQQGLVGYWPFCGNANDESGNGNDGEVNGATLTEDRFGNADAAYNFNGINNFIDLGSSPSLNSLDTNFSISAWVKDFSTSDNSNIISCHTPAYNWRYIVSTYGDSIVCGFTRLDDHNWAPNNTASGSISQNVWTNIVVVRNDTLFQIFIDGLLLSTSIVPLTPMDGYSENAITKIGINFPSAPDFDYFLGDLDDIAIYNRALTPEEVQELYTLDACTFTVYDTVTVENVINVYDTITIENIVDIYDTTYINVEVYDTLTVENVINVYDTLTVENVIDVYDTTFVTVTDTLIIDVLTGIGSGSVLNTLLLYPNPTSDLLTINYGNIASMAGYSLSIFSNGGSAVHETLITQSQETLDISGWSSGVYQVVVYNVGGVPVETRQIVIQ